MRCVFLATELQKHGLNFIFVRLDFLYVHSYHVRLFLFGHRPLQAASELIKTSVEPVLETYRPIIIASLKFSKLTLGTVAPQFTGRSLQTIPFIDFHKGIPNISKFKLHDCGFHYWHACVWKYFHIIMVWQLCITYHKIDQRVRFWFETMPHGTAQHVMKILVCYPVYFYLMLFPMTPNLTV